MNEVFFLRSLDILSQALLWFMLLPLFDWLCMGGYLGGISRLSGPRLPSDQTEHLEIIQRRRSSARLAHTEIVKETSKNP